MKCQEGKVNRYEMVDTDGGLHIGKELLQDVMSETLVLGCFWKGPLKVSCGVLTAG